MHLKSVKNTCVICVLISKLDEDYLIQHSIIARRIAILSGQKAKHAQPILNGDQNDFLVEQIVWFVFARRTADEVASVDPDDHGTTLLDHQVAGEHVQPKAVLLACRHS